MTDDLNKLNDLYGFEITTDISPDVYEYVLLNLKRIKNYRLQFDIPIVGIAGRHGKTITKKMITTILQSRGKVLETPLFSRTATNITSTLLKLDEQIDYAILEFGIQHENQFKLAVDIASPTHAILTNIGESNYAYLGDKVLVSEIKAELIKQIPENGVVLLNFDDDLCSMLDRYAKTPNVIKFGLNPNSHFHATSIEYLGPEGVKFKINDIFEVHLAVYTTGEIYNALAAIGLARTLDFDIEESARLLSENFRMPSGRGNLIETNKMWLLDFSYDASPESLSKASRSLIDFKKYSEKLILIVGEMGDFGDNNQFYYHNAGYFLGALPIDTFITIGKKTRLLADGVKKVNHHSKVHVLPGIDMEKILGILEKEIKPKSTVLVTGSYQQELHTIVQKLQSEM